MSIAGRLDQVYQKAPSISINNKSKFILFSDLHRGSDNKNDDFSQNRHLFEYALKYYLKRKFHYIELGDGDELWENKRFWSIRKGHERIFELMKKMYDHGRLTMIFGNHDMERKDARIRRRFLHRVYDSYREVYVPLFENMTVFEGLRLNYNNGEAELFCVHGHQGDWLNDRLWKIGRFFVRYVWVHLQNMGFHNPSSPAQEYKKRRIIEKKIIKWSASRRQAIVMGHTHRTRFSDPDHDAAPYFNTGNGVHRAGITGIEIEKGAVSLVLWRVSTRDDGAVYVERRLVQGPLPLSRFKEFFTGPFHPLPLLV